MITIGCAKCGTEFDIAEERAGKTCKCPGCGESVVIPSSLSGYANSPPPAAVPRASAGSVSPAGGQEWYCRVGGQQYGPISQEQLKQWNADGRCGGADLVWTSMMPQWAPLESVRGLLGLPSAPPMGAYQSASQSHLRPSSVAGSSSGKTCSRLSIVCGAVAFLLFPPLFGLAGLVLGIIGTVQSEDKSAGIVGIILSILGTIVGMIIGAAIWSAL